MLARKLSLEFARSILEKATKIATFLGLVCLWIFLADK